MRPCSLRGSNSSIAALYKATQPPSDILSPPPGTRSTPDERHVPIIGPQSAIDALNDPRRMMAPFGKENSTGVTVAMLLSHPKHAQATLLESMPLASSCATCYVRSSPGAHKAT